MEVITRLQPVFAYVETTEEGAGNHVLEWIDQLSFVAEPGRTGAVGEYIDQLERFQYAARFVHFGDDLGADGVLLTMIMVPHQPLVIDAHGDDEETWYLIFRCAGVLGYDVFEPEVETVEPVPDLKRTPEYAAAVKEESTVPAPAPLATKRADARDYERRSLSRQN
jgi:hypothetical protein